MADPVRRMERIARLERRTRPVGGLARGASRGRGDRLRLEAEAPALDDLDSAIEALEAQDLVVEAPPAPAVEEVVVVEVPELPDVAAPPPAPAPAQTRTHTVQRGETLRLIAERYYGSRDRSDEIFQANRGTLADPNRIRPGQVLTIP